LKSRKKGHFANLQTNKHENQHLQNAYNKYGKDAFIFIPILYCESFELLRYEQIFVNKYKTSNLLYNICIKCVNTRLGVTVSKKTRQKISISLRGRKASKKTRQKMSISSMGHKVSKETREKIRKSLMGHEVSKKTRDKISETNKNPSEKTRKKMSKSQMGKTHIDKTKRKMSKTRKGILLGPQSKSHRKNISKSKMGVPQKPCSEDHKKKISLANATKKEIILKIRKMLKKNIPVRIIVEKLGISRSTVYRTKNGFYIFIYGI